MAINVFEDNDGVVDQTRKSQRESTENHAVNRASAEGKRDKGGENRERNREKYSNCRAQTAQEEQNHERGQKQAHGSFVEQSAHGSFDEARLVEEYAGQKVIGNVDK